MYNDIGRIIVVDEREYILLGRINYEKNSYVYLMSSNSPLNILMAREEETSSNIVELEIIDEESEKKKIYELFVKGAKLGLL